jgi:hypothetical protein
MRTSAPPFSDATDAVAVGVLGALPLDSVSAVNPATLFYGHELTLRGKSKHEGHAAPMRIMVVAVFVFVVNDRFKVEPRRRCLQHLIAEVRQHIRDGNVRDRRVVGPRIEIILTRLLGLGHNVPGCSVARTVHFGGTAFAATAIAATLITVTPFAPFAPLAPFCSCTAAAVRIIAAITAITVVIIIRPLRPLGPIFLEASHAADLIVCVRCRLELHLEELFQVTRKLPTRHRTLVVV